MADKIYEDIIAAIDGMRVRALELDVSQFAKDVYDMALRHAIDMIKIMQFWEVK